MTDEEQILIHKILEEFAKITKHSKQFGRVNIVELIGLDADSFVYFYQAYPVCGIRGRLHQFDTDFHESKLGALKELFGKLQGAAIFL